MKTISHTRSSLLDEKNSSAQKTQNLLTANHWLLIGMSLALTMKLDGALKSTHGQSSDISIVETQPHELATNENIQHSLDIGININESSTILPVTLDSNNASIEQNSLIPEFSEESSYSESSSLEAESDPLHAGGGEIPLPPAPAPVESAETPLPNVIEEPVAANYMPPLLLLLAAGAAIFFVDRQDSPFTPSMMPTESNPPPPPTPRELIITGQKINLVDGQPDLTYLAGWRFFIDSATTPNGKYDVGEPVGITDENGNFMLTYIVQPTDPAVILTIFEDISVNPASAFYNVIPPSIPGQAVTYESPLAIDLGTLTNILTLPLQDIFVGTVIEPPSVLLLNDPNNPGTFTVGTPPDSEPATFEWGVQLADFNGDGFLDAFVATDAGVTNLLYIGNGDNTFQSPVDPSGDNVMNQTFDLTVGDFDGINGLDVIVVTTFGGPVQIYLNDGAGAFALTQSATLSAGVGVTSGDYNHDGFLDVFIPEYESSLVMQGKGDGTFLTEAAASSTAFSSKFPDINQIQAVTADFNGDGNPDVMVTSAAGVFLYAGRSLVTINNNGGTFFEDPIQIVVNTNDYWGIDTADFNKDGFVDVAIACNDPSGTNIWLENPGDGTFDFILHNLTPNNSANAGGLGLAAGDINQDGFIDIVIAQGNSGTVAYINDQAGGFLAGVQINNTNALDVAVGDFDYFFL